MFGVQCLGIGDLEARERGSEFVIFPVSSRITSKALNCLASTGLRRKAKSSKYLVSPRERLDMFGNCMVSFVARWRILQQYLWVSKVRPFLVNLSGHTDIPSGTSPQGQKPPGRFVCTLPYSKFSVAANHYVGVGCLVVYRAWCGRFIRD